MGEKKLITLFEIAQEIQVNYRTLLSCKREFSDFVFGTSSGRLMRYLPDFIDFFQLIFGLKDQGYTTTEIRSMLQGDIPEGMNNSLKKWLIDWKSRIEANFFQIDRPMDEWMNRSTDERISGLMDESMNGLTDERMDGSTDRSMDERMNGQDDSIKTSNTSENQTSGSGLGEEFLENRLSQLKAELQSQLSELADQKIKDALNRRISNLQSGLEQALLSMSAEINSPLTQFYKQISEIQEGINTLEARLGHLESNLGEETAEEIRFSDLDLDQMQVSSPKIDLTQDSDLSDSIEEESLGYSEQDQDQMSPIDLEFVKNSIHNGRPDREAVIRWIQSERKNNPELSYSDLATKLNEAKIPTLSGRDEWSRSVVRNLAVRGNGE